MTRSWRVWTAMSVVSVAAMLGLAPAGQAAPDPSVQLPAIDPSVQLPPLDPSVQLPASDPTVQPLAPDPSVENWIPPVSPADQAPTAPAVQQQVADASNPSAAQAGCLPDPSAEIARGGVWNGKGRCYIVPEGVGITSPVVVENATFFDPSSTPPLGERVTPIIGIKDTSGVQLNSLTLVGTNTTGAPHTNMVGEAGIDILSSDSVSITNVTTANTYGDGITLGFQPGHDPSRNLTVNGLTVSNAGREGITVAYVKGATMNNVDVLSSAESAWDFESDLHGVGSGNMIITNASSDRGIRIIEWLSGPVEFHSPSIAGFVSVTGEAALSGQPVFFLGGSILLRDTFHGIPPAGIWVDGPGNLQFTDVDIGRKPTIDAITGQAWLAVHGAHLMFDGGSVTFPFGSNDAASSVLFAG